MLETDHLLKYPVNLPTALLMKPLILSTTYPEPASSGLSKKAELDIEDDP
jgi:hypothetical protein